MCKQCKQCTYYIVLYKSYWEISCCSEQEPGRILIIILLQLYYTTHVIRKGGLPVHKVKFFRTLPDHLGGHSSKSFRQH